MALPANVGDVFLCTLKGTLANQTILSTFWYHLNLNPGLLNVDAVYALLDTEMSKLNGILDDYTECCPNDYTLEELWVQRIDNGRAAKQVFPHVIPGNDPADARTANISAVILRKGEIAARNNISTLHVPLAPSVANMVNGTLEPLGVKLSLGILATEMLVVITDLVGTELTPSIYQPAAVIPLLPRTITSVQVMDTVRVMRRRTVGLGI